MVELQEAAPAAARSWYQPVFAFIIAIGALAVVAFIIVMLYLIARYTADVTGVWPMHAALNTAVHSAGASPL